jgi:hypothetical protein
MKIVITTPTEVKPPTDNGMARVLKIIDPQPDIVKMTRGGRTMESISKKKSC